jgi:hypothetical protein
MAAPIALAVICLFAAGAVAGITGVVAVAIRREDRNLTLTSQAPGTVTRAGRRLTGPRPHRHRGPGEDAGLAHAAGRTWDKRNLVPRPSLSGFAWSSADRSPSPGSPDRRLYRTTRYARP